MEWTNGDTSVLAIYVAQTRSGVTWCARFFYKIHVEETEGTYDENKWKKLFKEAVIKSFPLFFDGKSVVGKPNLDAEKVDWNQFYSHCFKLTKPRPDIFKRNEE